MPGIRQNMSALSEHLKVDSLLVLQQIIGKINNTVWLRSSNTKSNVSFIGKVCNDYFFTYNKSIDESTQFLIFFLFFLGSIKLFFVLFLLLEKFFNSLFFPFLKSNRNGGLKSVVEQEYRTRWENLYREGGRIRQCTHPRNC
jgi:hypothetical protein